MTANPRRLRIHFIWGDPFSEIAAGGRNDVAGWGPGGSEQPITPFVDVPGIAHDVPSLGPPDRTPCQDRRGVALPSRRLPQPGPAPDPAGVRRLHRRRLGVRRGRCRLCVRPGRSDRRRRARRHPVRLARGRDAVRIGPRRPVPEAPGHGRLGRHEGWARALCGRRRGRGRPGSCRLRAHGPRRRVRLAVPLGAGVAPARARKRTCRPLGRERRLVDGRERRVLRRARRSPG